MKYKTRYEVKVGGTCIYESTDIQLAYAYAAMTKGSKVTKTNKRKKEWTI